jgi:nucleoside-diphosphate-sugar epimerase
MIKSLFLAGATGAIGRRLVPLLVAEGWSVFGMTRFADKAPLLRALGAMPVVADIFDALAVEKAFLELRPSAVVHQLTDLPAGLNPEKMAEATARNARIREEGTANLVRAALHVGVRRIVAQSIAFAYEDGPLPHTEADALNIGAEGRAGISARGAASLERQILSADGIILRYGRLYGPATGFDAPAGPCPVHVDAAANAAALAVSQGEPGIYNIAEDDGTVSSEKAKRFLDWSAGWRLAE